MLRNVFTVCKITCHANSCFFLADIFEIPKKNKLQVLQKKSVNSYSATLATQTCLRLGKIHALF